MPKLKPCPFCDGKAGLFKGFIDGDETNDYIAYVQCFNCGCKTVTNKKFPSQSKDDVIDYVIRAWNRRVDNA